MPPLPAPIKQLHNDVKAALFTSTMPWTVATAYVNKTPVVHKWLLRHRRFHLHFTPTTARG